MKLRDIMNENAEALKIFKKYGRRNGQLFAQNDAQDEKIDAIVDDLEAAGFRQRKANGGEYDYEYVKGDEVVRINYRFGRGYQAIWIPEK